MKKDENRLAEGDFLLQKFSGKGGWTYAEIPSIAQNKNNPFGWVKVRGSVDDFPLEHYKLMPMGNGKLFLPIKAALRKKIGKEAGDSVYIVLYADETPRQIPEEIVQCFKNEAPALYQTFLHFTEGEQFAYLNWIYEAKTEETKANRIAEMMLRLQTGLKMYDKKG
ncbi:MAG: DUF1905 domain-containing protein [Bacteroidia bacterium]